MNASPGISTTRKRLDTIVETADTSVRATKAAHLVKLAGNMQPLQKTAKSRIGTEGVQLGIER